MRTKRRLRLTALIFIVCTLVVVTWRLLVVFVPPSEVREFAWLINASPQEFYAAGHPRDKDELRFRDFRQRNADTNERVKARAKGPWKLLRWAKIDRGGYAVYFRDGVGNDLLVNPIFAASDGKLAAALYWPYIKGRTLDEMADSAMEVTGSPGVLLGYWKHGKVEITTRGVRATGSSEKLTIPDRWPANIKGFLVQMALVRLIDDGRLSADSKMPDLLKSFKVPEVGAKMTLREFLSGHPNGGFASSRSRLPSVARRDMRKYLEGIFKNDAREMGREHVEIPDAVIGTAILDGISNGRAESVVLGQMAKPMGWSTAGFGDPDVDMVRSSSIAREPIAAPFLGDGKAFCLSAKDLLAYGQFFLSCLRGKSDLISPASFALLHRRFDGYDDYAGLTVLGWTKIVGPKGESWVNRLWPGLVLMVLPKQNAVVMVGVQNEEYSSIEYVGPIQWRIAEEIIGFPRANE